jgi:subtilisin-like proprotein convertase family protein
VRGGAILGAATLALSSSGCALYNGLLGVCEGEVFEAQVNQAIPDDNEAGVNSMISLPYSGRPDGIGIKLDLEHELESDLTIRLAHQNVVIELDGPGDTGPFHQFDNVDLSGPWILNVADTLSADTGYWTSWELSVCGQ